MFSLKDTVVVLAVEGPSPSPPFAMLFHSPFPSCLHSATKGDSLHVGNVVTTDEGNRQIWQQESIL